MEQLAEILEEKKKQLINGINPLEVQFSLDEVNTLNDKEQLALLRVGVFYFKKSNDSCQCYGSVPRVKA